MASSRGRPSLSRGAIVVGLCSFPRLEVDLDDVATRVVARMKDLPRDQAGTLRIIGTREEIENRLVAVGVEHDVLRESHRCLLAGDSMSMAPRHRRIQGGHPDSCGVSALSVEACLPSPALTIVTSTMHARHLRPLISLVVLVAACAGDTATPATSTSPTTEAPVAIDVTTRVPLTATTATPETTLPVSGTSTQPTAVTTIAPPTPRTERIQIAVAGRVREYTLHVPSGLDGAPTALVVDLHGLTSTPDRQELVSGMRTKGAEEGFVVAQPTSALVANAWDTLEGSADVAFAQAIVEDVSSRIDIDPDRIFATGFSAGGGMAARLACDATDLFAAVGVVAGAHFGWRRCEAEAPVPIIGFYGSGDKVVPYEGFGLLPGVVEWAMFRAATLGCETTPAATGVADDVVLQSWTNCDGSSALLLYTIAEGGHGWPGTDDPSRVGDTTDAIDATDLMWQFFDSHPKR